MTYANGCIVCNGHHGHLCLIHPLVNPILLKDRFNLAYALPNPVRVVDILTRVSDRGGRVCVVCPICYTLGAMDSGAISDAHNRLLDDLTARSEKR